MSPRHFECSNVVAAACAASRSDEAFSKSGCRWIPYFSFYRTLLVPRQSRLPWADCHHHQRQGRHSRRVPDEAESPRPVYILLSLMNQMNLHVDDHLHMITRRQSIIFISPMITRLSATYLLLFDNGRLLGLLLFLLWRRRLLLLGLGRQRCAETATASTL